MPVILHAKRMKMEQPSEIASAMAEVMGRVTSFELSKFH